MSTVFNQIEDLLFGVLTDFIYSLYATYDGFVPYAMVLFGLLVFVPAFCFVIRRVFNG